MADMMGSHGGAIRKYFTFPGCVYRQGEVEDPCPTLDSPEVSGLQNGSIGYFGASDPTGGAVPNVIGFIKTNSAHFADIDAAVACGGYVRFTIASPKSTTVLVVESQHLIPPSDPANTTGVYLYAPNSKDTCGLTTAWVSSDTDVVDSVTTEGFKLSTEVENQKVSVLLTYEHDEAGCPQLIKVSSVDGSSVYDLATLAADGWKLSAGSCCCADELSYPAGDSSSACPDLDGNPAYKGLEGSTGSYMGIGDLSGGSVPGATGFIKAETLVRDMLQAALAVGGYMRFTLDGVIVAVIKSSELTFDLGTPLFHYAPSKDACGLTTGWPSAQVTASSSWGVEVFN